MSWMAVFNDYMRQMDRLNKLAYSEPAFRNYVAYCDRRRNTRKTKKRR